jgi:hypothetical protein
VQTSSALARPEKFVVKVAILPMADASLANTEQGNEQIRYLEGYEVASLQQGPVRNQ